MAEPPIPERAHGFCYLAPQCALYFGSDRRHPVEWRPVVSLSALGDLRYVLPSTTQDHAEFFRLGHERCFRKRADSKPRDSYLSPRVEAIHRAGLIEIGILAQPDSLAIAAWMRAQRGERVA